MLYQIAPRKTLLLLEYLAALFYGHLESVHESFDTSLAMIDISLDA